MPVCLKTNVGKEKKEEKEQARLTTLHSTGFSFSVHPKTSSRRSGPSPAVFIDGMTIIPLSGIHFTLTTDSLTSGPTSTFHRAGGMVGSMLTSIPSCGLPPASAAPCKRSTFGNQV